MVPADTSDAATADAATADTDVIASGDRDAIKTALIHAAEAVGICYTGGKDTPEARRIEALAQALEALSPSPEPANHPAMDGRWQTLYSTLPLPGETTLRRLSFARLPRTKIEVTGLLQDVNRHTGQYDNVVSFETVAGRVPGHQVMRGLYHGDPEVPVRLQITFRSTAVKPIDDFDAETFVKGIVLEDGDQLDGEVDFQGWSDVTYLDDDFRLNRGQNGNLYVLRKLSDRPGKV